MPQPPYHYRDEEVSVFNASANITLAGTLSIPERTIKAAAVLITGSGPQDRDETILGHKPFAVIAHHLANRGIAVLRMDDRGVNQSQGQFNEAITQDFASDISAAVSYLQQRDDMPEEKIGLIGHSEGGMVGPMVAAERKDIAFLILLAAPGISIDQLYAEQRYLILKAAGLPEDKLNLTYSGEQRLFKEIAELPLDKEISESIKQEALQIYSAMPRGKFQVEQLFKFISTNWFRHFLVYKPEKYLSKVTAPILALNGSLDLQVAAESNLKGLETILSTHDHKDYTLKNLKGLNHLFQTAKTGSPDEYKVIEETFSPVALNAMTQWLDERFTER